MLRENALQKESAQHSSPYLVYMASVHPGPPYPTYGGAKVILGRLLLKDHSDPHRVKYFWEALDLKFPLDHYWGVPRPP